MSIIFYNVSLPVKTIWCMMDSLNCQVMWAEAMAKLEGMESSKRERLWPQLAQGFKDLSQRLKVNENCIG